MNTNEPLSPEKIREIFDRLDAVIKSRPKKPPVVIGSRYIRDHRKVEDRDSGRYEEVNPVIEGHAALIQMALLAGKVTVWRRPFHLGENEVLVSYK